MSQPMSAPVTVEDSMKKLREAIRGLEKVCVQKENDVKARQQDLFGGASLKKNNDNVVKLDIGKIQKKLDATISQVETMLGENV
jgi:hypothetical protein